MADVPPELARLSAAAEAARNIERDLVAARRELRAALADARAAGHSISAIARLLGVSRQRVYTLIERER